MRLSTLWAICALCCLQPAFATDQVLLMAISEYPTKPLDGVKYDIDNALKLAQKLGYDTSRAVILKDQQLTHEGLRQAFSDLKQRTRKNDRVFIYYSGHGASLLRDGKCTQALVPIDTTPKGENLFSMAELNRGLDEIKGLTSEAMVVIDACHSGGLREIATARGAGGKSGTVGRLSAKAWTPAAGEICSDPINITKQWGARGAAAKVIVFVDQPESNFVFIAAANEREIAFDDPDRGGLATQALTQCATQGVLDSDGSQGISARELAACAQQRIEAEVRKINQADGANFKPHRVEVYGNDSRNLRIAAQPSSTATPDRAEQTIAAFQQIAAGSNGNWPVEVSVSASHVKFGEKVGFNYSTNQPGYVSVLYVGSDRKDIQSLLVNKRVSQAYRATLGRTAISEPAGENTFLVIFSQAPLDLDVVLRDGKVSISAQALKDIHCATTAGKSRNATKFSNDDPCPEQTRNAKKIILDAPDEVAGYAARVVTVRGE